MRIKDYKNEIGPRPAKDFGPQDEWIEGVVLTKRRVFNQYGRGHFAEILRSDSLDFEIKQWSAASMLRGTVKGFHIHPQSPDGDKTKEQWDIMYFLTSLVEIILKDERKGLDKKVMRIIIDGDSTPSENNYSVIIPSGVAHAIRNIGREDLIMVYGTSTVFDPKNEGRIESDPELDKFPKEWKNYINQ